MAPVCCGHAGPANVPAVLDWLRKFQDGDVVFKGVAVPSGVLDDPEANSVSWGSKDPAFSWLWPGLYIMRISEVSSYKLPSYGDVNSLGSV